MELFQASHQWSKRPDDERFESIEALHKATLAYFKTKVERPDVPANTLRVEADGKEVVLVGKGNIPAKMTHWAFGSLMHRVQCPAYFMRELPPTLAAQVINHKMKAMGEDEAKVNLLFHRANGGYITRSISSDRYERFWNHEIAERLFNSVDQGWRVPPARPARANQTGTRPATEKDVLDNRGGGGGLSINVGDLIAPAGIYASDHDMFVFLINENNRIQDGTPGGLSRGMFIKNSEVSGAAKFGIAKFLFRHVCGNHIVWDASAYEEISFRHVGHNTLRQKITQAFETTLVKYANESASDQEAKIKSAKKKVLGATKEEVLDLIFGKRIMGRKAAETAYDAALPDIDGDPKTVYGFVNGATRVSQNTPFADERVDMDQAAAKILSLAF